MTMITVAGKFPPKQGGKRWTVKDTNGNLWGAFAEVASQIHQDGTYDITAQSRDWQGQTYHTITKVASQQAAVAQQARLNGSAALTQKDRFIFMCACIKELVGDIHRSGAGPHALADAIKWSYAAYDQAHAAKSAEPNDEGYTLEQTFDYDQSR